MSFPNALEGIKKIYRAEILGLLAEVFAVIAALLGLIGLVLAAAGGEGSAAAGFLGAGTLLIISAVLAIISFILNIIGLNKAKVDEENFKFALYVVIFGIIGSIVLGFADSDSILHDLGDIISDISSFLITFFVCTGIINLADKLGNKIMKEKGINARKMLLAVWILGIILAIVSTVFDLAGKSDAVAIFGAVIALAAGIIQIIAYILYLKLLSKARTMLEA